MNDKQFQVRLSGKLTGSHAQADAVTSMARLFKVDEAKAAQLLGGTPRVIKSGLDMSSAEKYCAALTAIGVHADVVPVAGAIATPTTTPATASAKPVPPRPAAQSPQSSPSAPAPKPAPAAPQQSTPQQSAPQQSTLQQAAPAPAAPQPGLPFRLEGRPDFAMLTVQLPAGETIKVEAAAMAAMDTNLVMKTKLGGGFKRLLTGENIFINEFTAEGGGADISIAPASPGDIGHVFLRGNDVIYLQNSAFVASGMGVNIETKWQGLIKGFFSGESLFLIRASGAGDLWFNTYGAMIELDVDGDYVVDTGNIVAFTDGLTYDVRKVGGYKSLFFSGEGFVCHFSGKGKVWIQTRGVQAFAAWASWFRPTKRG